MTVAALLLGSLGTVGLFVALFLAVQLAVFRDIVASLEHWVSELSEANDEKSVATPIELDENERRELQAQLNVRWNELVCQYCGRMHPGLCPRVRNQRVERSPAGEVVETTFWRQDQWKPDEGTIRPADVYGSSVVPTIEAKS